MLSNKFVSRGDNKNKLKNRVAIYFERCVKKYIYLII